MSYQEKKIIVLILTGIFVLTAYSIYAFNKVQSGMAAPDDLKFWATAMLIFIGIGVVAAIVIQIVFHILLSIAIAVKEQVKNGKCDDKEIEKTIELEMVEDEMDRLIGLKSLRISYAIAGFGFMAALVSLVLNYSPAVMLNILFFSIGIGSLIESIAQLYFYRSGVKNG
ncbi:MAG TPA: hypothetical protein VEA58_02005 [Anaerovoracaceae bacterium]|nr:hypothetical protein [Anaerovoracaceae bacterium]